MNNNEKINQKIDFWSKSLSERIIEMKFVDVNEINSIISIYLKGAMYDCLREQIPETQRKLNELKIKTSKNGNKQVDVRELISVKQKLKEENEMYANLDRENMGREMALWMREKHPESILDFYDYYNDKYKKPLP